MQELNSYNLGSYIDYGSSSNLVQPMETIDLHQERVRGQIKQPHEKVRNF